MSIDMSMRRAAGALVVAAAMAAAINAHAQVKIDVIASATGPTSSVGTPAAVLPMDDRKRWVFRTTRNGDIIGDRLIEHMTKRGVRAPGFIGYNDTYGES